MDWAYGRLAGRQKVCSGRQGEGVRKEVTVVVDDDSCLQGTGETKALI